VRLFRRAGGTAHGPEVTSKPGSPARDAIHRHLNCTERHLNHLVSVFINYYHRLRPHQAKENAPPLNEAAPRQLVERRLFGPAVSGSGKLAVV